MGGRRAASVAPLVIIAVAVPSTATEGEKCGGCTPCVGSDCHCRRTTTTARHPRHNTLAALETAQRRQGVHQDREHAAGQGPTLPAGPWVHAVQRVETHCPDRGVLAGAWAFVLWSVSKFFVTTFWSMKLLIEHSKWGVYRSFPFLKTDSQLLETSL
jgi:hypothetical protein